MDRAHSGVLDDLYGTFSSGLNRRFGAFSAYYLLPVAGWQVSVEVRMVSTHGGENLVRATGSRYAVQVMPALSVQDIVINSAENVLQLRDIILAQAEEETCREIVHRVPVSQELKVRIETTRNRRR